MPRDSVANSVRGERGGSDGEASPRAASAGLVWHTQPIDAVLEALDTSPNGLTNDEAVLRLDWYGPNELQTLQRTSPWHSLAAQFKNVLIVILRGPRCCPVCLVMLSRRLSSRSSCCLPSSWGSCRIYRAERALEALRQMAALATDGLPALALAVDPPEPDLMYRKPRNPRAGIFTRPLLVLLLTGGVWSGVVNISLFAWLLRTGRPVEQAIAMTFVSLVLIQFFKAYNYRSDRLSVRQRPFANHWLNLAIVWELVLLGVIIYVPWFHAPFGTFSLSVADWLLVTALAFTVVPVLETVKWMERHEWFGELV